MYVKIRLNTFIIIMCIFLLGVSFQSKYRANTFLSHVMCFHSKANPYIINVRNYRVRIDLLLLACQFDLYQYLPRIKKKPLRCPLL